MAIHLLAKRFVKHSATLIIRILFIRNINCLDLLETMQHIHHYICAGGVVDIF